MAGERVATSKVAGTWPWLLQRLSGVLLIVLLGIHIIVTHFWHPGEDITVGSVHERLRELTFIVVDYSMLAVVLYHGLNGTRTVLLDFDRFAKRRRAVDIGLTILGIAMMIWGIVILWPFITG